MNVNFKTLRLRSQFATSKSLIEILSPEATVFQSLLRMLSARFEVTNCEFNFFNSAGGGHSGN